MSQQLGQPDAESGLSNFEIQTLRQEQLDAISMVINIAQMALAAVAALITAAITLTNENRGLVPLLGFLVLGAGLAFAVVRQRAMLRISVYLQLYAGKKFQWERRVEMFREKNGHRWSPFNVILWSFAAAGVVCSAVSCMLGVNFWLCSIAAISWVALATLLPRADTPWFGLANVESIRATWDQVALDEFERDARHPRSGTPDLMQEQGGNKTAIRTDAALQAEPAVTN